MDKSFKDTFPQARSFEDFRSEISIIELATAHGYHLESNKGLRTPVFYNPEYNDRIIIMDPRNPANQGYWNPEDETDKGTLITFVKRRLGTIFPRKKEASDQANVNRVLYHYLRLDPFVRQKNRQLVNYEALGPGEAGKFSLASYPLQPVTHTDFLRSRHIAAATLRAPEFAGKLFSVLYTDPNQVRPDYINTVFPYFVAGHDKIVGLEIRNTDFMTHAEGSDRSHGVWHSNMPARLERIVMVESALDALSYQELKKQKNNLYISYGGNLSLNQIQTIQELQAQANAADNFHYVSASDNDKKGAYYDLMFIRSIAASYLPSQRLAHVRNYVKLVFPEFRCAEPDRPANLSQFAESLMARLQPYQDQVAEEIRKAATPEARRELEKNKISFHLEAGQLQVQIPNNYLALHTFNQKFIQAAGLEYTIRLDKALLNDYNDDLKLLKLVNAHPDLLAEFNKKDLRRIPPRALNYLDLKFVLLQPGRFELLRKTFGLSRNQEAGNPVLKFSKTGDKATEEAPGKAGKRKNKGQGTSH